MSQERRYYEGQMTGSAVKVYTAEPGHTHSLRSIHLTNITSGAVAARVDLVPAGSSDGSTLQLIDRSVAANADIEALSEPVEMSDGDMLYVIAGSATSIDVVISGVDDSNL